MASESKEYNICHFWYFLDKGFNFSRCHDLLMVSMNNSNITILNIKGALYYCITSEISKTGPQTSCKILIWPKKKQNIIKHKHLLLHIKLDKEILTFGDMMTYYKSIMLFGVKPALV